MKLRFKILLALVIVSIVPLVISLWIAGGMSIKELNGQLSSRVNRASIFLQQTTTNASMENLKYVKLLANNPFLVNAVYSTKLSGDQSQLESVLSNDELPFDQIQILDNDGKQIYRQISNMEELPSTSGVEHPVIEATLEGEAYAETGVFDGRMAIVAGAPVTMYGDPIGHLVGVTFFDASLAKRLKSLSAMEIAFFDGRGVFFATSEELGQISMDDVLNSSEYRMQIDGLNHKISYVSIGNKERGVLMALNVTDIEIAEGRIQKLLLVVRILNNHN